MKKIFIPIIAAVIIAVLPLCAFGAEKLYAQSLSGSLDLHMAPSATSPKLTKIPACASLKLIETQRTWCKVIFRKKVGWVNISFTADSYKNAALATGNDARHNVIVKAKSGSTTLYSLPSSKKVLGSTEKYNAPNDTILSIERETENGWGLVSMNGKYAWVKLKDVKEYDNEEKDPDEYNIYYAYVLSKNGAGLGITQSPDSETPLATIPDCVKLTVRDVEGSKAYVSYDGINGWIDIKQTTSSLSNAQNNAGKEADTEARITTAEGETDMLCIPSDKASDGAFSVKKVKNDDVVYVIRKTESGWSLIASEGVRGWVKDENLVPLDETDVENIELCEPYSVFVCTKEGKGLPLYTDSDCSEKPFATVPECSEVKVIIKENNGNMYITSDYAAGWIKHAEFAKSYKYAVNCKTNNKKKYYKIKTDTELKSVPTYSEFCGCKDLSMLYIGQEFSVTRTVVTGKRKWGLATVDGKQGWINLNCAEHNNPFVIYFVIGAAAVIICLVILIFIFFRRRLQCKKSTK